MGCGWDAGSGLGEEFSIALVGENRERGGVTLLIGEKI
jgi:hypothetical protein